MATAATVLQSQQLVGNIAAFQHGIPVDMRLLLSVPDPLVRLNYETDTDPFWGDDSDLIRVIFAPLHAAMTAWYNKWGHARLLKLFACLPQMQLRVIAHAVWSGNLSVLTLLPVNMLREVPSRVVDLAALQPDKCVLEHLHDGVGIYGKMTRAMYNAAQCGHLQVVRYLNYLNNETDVEMAATAAVRHGHLDVVEFLHVHCASCNLRDAFLTAIQCMDLVVAEFIVDLVGKTMLEWSKPMDSAAASGKMADLEWLHQRGFACSTDAMDRAASNGHLDIVQWLHANRSEGCTKWAMHYAAVNGHLAVVEWLFTNRHEGCAGTTLEETIKNGNWEVVRYLVIHDTVSDVHEALKLARRKAFAPADVVPLLESAALKSNGRQQKKRCFWRV